MPNIFSSNYLARKPIEKAMKEFAKNFSKEMRVLDIGCGNKPYAKYFKCEYVGLDPFPETKADVIADAWAIPLPDNSFDGVILNQSLEHIKKVPETISEIKRVLKPDGLGIVTAPQTMKNHSDPVLSDKSELNNFDKGKIKYWNNDFYRFTKFGLIYLFRDFEIFQIKETNGYASTILQLENYFFASFKLGFIFAPIYFLNNVLGIFFDFIFLPSRNKYGSKFIEKFNEFVYRSLTLNYVMIIKKK